MLVLKNQAINSNLCHLPLIILTTFTVHRDMMRNKHLLGVAPYPHRVLTAATLQKPSADFVKQWNPWIVLTNVAGPVYPPENIQNIRAKQKVFFSWNSAYHQSCKTTNCWWIRVTLAFTDAKKRCTIDGNPDIIQTSDIIQTQEIRARFCGRYFYIHETLKLNIVNILLRAGYKGKGPYFWMNIRKKFQTCFTFFLRGTSRAYDCDRSWCNGIKTQHP